jgi:hypothetical protein
MRFITTLAWALILAAPATPIDYDQIERTIAREPTYRTKKPRYALLLFGPEAHLRVWVVLDGATLYVDRNGDADLTGKGKRFATEAECKGVEIKDPDRKTRYTIEAIQSDYSIYTPKARQEREKKGIPPMLMVSVAIQGPVHYRQYCDLQMRDDPRQAMLAHFHGPLTIGPRTINWKVPRELALRTGENPPDMNAVVGTMSAKHGCWVVVRSHNKDRSAFPKGVHPVVEIEFPPADPHGKPVPRKYDLDQFC